jgi:hypothetical protein
MIVDSKDLGLLSILAERTKFIENNEDPQSSSTNDI